MREIEIKAHISDRQALLDKLKEKGVLIGDAVRHRDRVFAKPSARDSDPNENWLRIRTENNLKNIFTLKRSVTGELDSIEHETEITDANELERIIELLGYELYSDLTKVRQKAHLGDIEICLDVVDELGTFIEAEKLVEDTADVHEIEKELWTALKSLGVDPKHKVLHGYDVLMRKKFGPPKTVDKTLKSTMVFLIRNNQVLLGEKRHGIGAGMLTGPGGVIHSAESVDQAVAQKCKESIGVLPTYFSKIGELEHDMWHDGKKGRIMTDLYVAEEWEGEAEETSIMTPKWVQCDDLPFKQLWPDAQYWLPHVLAGERVKGVFTYDENGDLITHNIRLVDDSQLTTS